MAIKSQHFKHHFRQDKHHSDATSNEAEFIIMSGYLPETKARIRLWLINAMSSEDFVPLQENELQTPFFIQDNHRLPIPAYNSIREIPISTNPSIPSTIPGASLLRVCVLTSSRDAPSPGQTRFIIMAKIFVLNEQRETIMLDEFCLGERLSATAEIRLEWDADAKGETMRGRVPWEAVVRSLKDSISMAFDMEGEHKGNLHLEGGRMAAF
jgi:hypothetical protein